MESKSSVNQSIIVDGAPVKQTVPWLGSLLVGIAVALTAQFLLDGWADQYDAAHWAQHGLLFFAGIMVGGGLLRLYQLGRGRA